MAEDYTEDAMLDWTMQRHAAEAMNSIEAADEARLAEDMPLCKLMLKSAEVHAMLAVAASIRDR